MPAVESGGHAGRAHAGVHDRSHCGDTAHDIGSAVATGDGAQVIARQTYDVASVRGMVDELMSSGTLPSELVEAVCSPEVVSQIWSARITASKL